MGWAERSEWRMFHNVCPLDKSRVASKLREYHPLFKNNPPFSDFYETRHGRNRSGICGSEQRNICTEQETTLPVLVDCKGQVPFLHGLRWTLVRTLRMAAPTIAPFIPGDSRQIHLPIDHISHSLHKNLFSEKHLLKH